jgi:hypothetical protein
MKKNTHETISVYLSQELADRVHGLLDRERASSLSKPNLSSVASALIRIGLDAMESRDAQPK